MTQALLRSDTQPLRKRRHDRTHERLSRTRGEALLTLARETGNGTLLQVMSQDAAKLDDLIERCRQLEDEAWIELVQRFNQAVARWLAGLDYKLRPHDIEDLQQEVFKKVLQTLPHYRGNVPFPAWLYRQTESVVIDNFRKRSAAKRTVPGDLVSLHAQDAAGEMAVDAEDARPRPDELSARNDDRRLLGQALERLGPPDCLCRRLIAFCYFGGFKYEEAAQALQMHVRTVSSTLSKCLARLRPLAAEVFAGSKTEPPATDSK